MRASMDEISVDLKDLSDGELLDLAIPSDATRNNRRVLVMWLYLRERPSTSLEEFDKLVTQTAENELQVRSKRG